MQQKQFEMVYVTVFFHTEFIFVWSFKNGNGLLGCHKWVTSTGECQNLVPGLNSQRQGPARSVICRIYVIAYFLFANVISEIFILVI